MYVGCAMVFGTFRPSGHSLYSTLNPAPRSPASSLYVMYDNEDDTNLSQADTLEMNETFDRASLELARSACYVPELVSGPEVLCHY